MAPWKLPVIAAAIVVPIVAGFAIAGPGLGVGIAALVAFAIIWIAARQRPLGPLGSPAEDGRRHVLLVTTCAVEEPAAVRRIAAAAALGGRDRDAEVLVLSPARIGFLDRWASDVEGARQAAQRNLVATVAALAKAGIAAEARVGDEDVVQAVEDQLQSFPANEVVLVGEHGHGDEDDAAAAELRSRLRAQFHRVVLGGD
jgi:pyruvate dehydrogenase complex dehydrogenase (E1) component